LIQGLFAFVLPAHRYRSAASATDGIQFIYKDDTRSLFSCLIEKVPHAGCAHAYEHFDELRPADTEERYASFTAHGSGEKCLPRARRPSE
jgi:hypothetical protein